MGQVIIELLEVKEGKSIFKELYETRGKGVHLAFTVSNLERGLAIARNNGLTVLRVGALSDGGRVALIDGEGTDGVFLQLLEANKPVIERVAAESKELKPQT